MPDIVQDGYEFAGWYESEDFSACQVKGWSAETRYSNVHLYAKWALLVEASSLPEVIQNADKSMIIKAVGELNEDQLSDIGSAIKKSNFDIILDLSEITGLVSIKKNTFHYCSRLICIKLPVSVISIEDYAFCGCNNLTGITTSEGVTSIGDSAFFCCTGLTDIVIPGSVTSMGNHAFDSCSSLMDVTISKGVKSINFSGCSNLTSITIPEGVTSIGYYAFGGCSSLTSIVIPDSVTSIGHYAFKDCSDLKTVNYKGTIDQWCSIKFSNEFANPCYYSHKLLVNDIEITEIKIPDSVISIGSYTFFGCSSLTSIVIPGSVTSIGAYAFSGCSSLTSVIIPKSVISIEDYAFEKCYNLKDISIYLQQKQKIEKSAFTSGSEYYNLIISGSRELSIPLCDIFVCTPIKSVTISKEIVRIRENVFKNCSGLETVNYTGTLAQWCSIDFLGSFANPCCYSHKLLLKDIEITELIIPDKVASIGRYAFYGCSNITEVTIPESVKSIGNEAFRGCSGLKTVNYKGTIDQWCSIKFGKIGVGYAANPCLYSRKLLFNDIEITDLVISDNVTNIEAYAFCGCSNITSIIIPDSVISIGEAAFSYCLGITNVKIPDRLKCISDSTFYWSSNLKDITIPNGITSIGKSAFDGCSSLTNITIPDSVTSIGNLAFCKCSSLSNITIPDGVTSIGNSTFQGCSSLTDITIPKGVASIEEYTFCDCSNLNDITIPNSVTYIGDYVFYDCSSLTKLIIPESVTYIGRCAISYSKVQLTFLSDFYWWVGPYKKDRLYLPGYDQERLSKYEGNNYWLYKDIGE